MLFNSLSQIRSARFSCFPALPFISFVVLTLILTFTTKVYSAQVTLAWDANTENDLAGYKIHNGNSSRNYSSNVDIGNQTSYTISGLVEGETYFFAATAYDINGNESVYSNEVSYDVPIFDTTLPTTPTILQATTISTSQINLAWNSSTDDVKVTGYKIYRDGTQIATTTNTTYQNTGLSPSMTYTYTVTAYDAAGNESTQSLSASATTNSVQIIDTTSPTTPTILQATTISTSQINLAWNSSTDDVKVTGYKIYRDGTQIATTTNTTYQNTGLSPSMTYTYTVSAYDAAGNESTQSLSVLATTFTSNPVLDIKANFVDGPIMLGTSDTLSVTISLTAGDNMGVDCDWWVVAETPSGWYYYNIGTMEWVFAGGSYTDFSAIYQGPLFDLSPVEVFNISALPEGTYSFIFTIDTNMNGSLDIDQLFFDSVVVNINP